MMAVYVETVLTQRTNPFGPGREDISDERMLDLRLRCRGIFIRWIEKWGWKS